MKNTFFIIYYVLILLLMPQAHAYLDPGNGSMVLQLLLGGFAGAGVILHIYWERMANLCKSIFSHGAKSASSDINPEHKE